MIVVTGGAGFIGSNLVKGLNAMGRRDILVVDDLTEGQKFSNLADLDIADYWDKDDFLLAVECGEHLGIEVIFHQGACSTTTEWDGKFMMMNNYQYSKSVFHYCQEAKIPLIYASSAATYGDLPQFAESRAFERPLNVYGYSKFLFDEFVRARLGGLKAPVCGLRYFNVYGPREQHKGSMASVAFHLNAQILRGENPKLFAGSEGFKRDFIYIDDVVHVNLWAWQNHISGVLNCGTGRAESFLEVARAVVAYHGKGEVEFVAFPEHLKARYQAYTQADLQQLRAAGYRGEFYSVAEGVADYLRVLNG